MTDLNDVEALRALDVGDMLGAVASMPRHAREGYAAGMGAEGLASADGVTAITFCGMGGSAVAGDVLRSLYRDRLIVPVEVNRSPELPAYAGPRTMVVVSSYSGNTAETLASFEEAVARGCRVLPITSGGMLAARAGELGLGAVRIPGGYMPRAALGYLSLSLLGAMEAVGLLPRLAGDVDEATGELDRLAEALRPDLPTHRNEAKALAERISHRQPVVWGADGLGAVAAARWKTQLNENGKVPPGRPRCRSSTTTRSWGGTPTTARTRSSLHFDTRVNTMTWRCVSRSRSRSFETLGRSPMRSGRPDGARSRGSCRS